MGRCFALFILLAGFVSGLDVDMDCPKSVFVGENFSCDVSVDDGDGEYDLKVAVDSRRNSVLEILDGEVWKSSYYYLSAFVEDEGLVWLRFNEAGEYDFVLKLRDGSNRKEFEGDSIRVLEARKVGLDSAEDDSGAVEEDLVISLNDVEIGGVDEEVEGVMEELVYVSREWRVVEMLPYGFCLFLILLIGVLVWRG